VFGVTTLSTCIVFVRCISVPWLALNRDDYLSTNSFSAHSLDEQSISHNMVSFFSIVAVSFADTTRT
jgi:hypothetical protein